ncbi:MAG: hypothetical protein HRU28_11725 [Rhizobiales bacterium]|nr:hypothetical protein [Hyphomicrobiales bacterium]
MRNLPNRATNAWHKSFMKPKVADFIWFGFDWIIAEIEREQQRWFIWLICVFACGIVIFHLLNLQFFSLYLPVFGCFLVILGLFLRQNRMFLARFGVFLPNIRWLFASFCIVFTCFLGFLAANIELFRVNTAGIDYPIYKTNLQGSIVAIELFSDSSARLLIKPNYTRLTPRPESLDVILYGNYL